MDGIIAFSIRSHGKVRLSPFTETPFKRSY